MKITLMIGILTASITFLPSISTAKSDDSTSPAANFQPKILYQDKELTNTPDATNQSGEKSSYDPNYPATNFQPTVVYLDKEAVTAASASSFIGEKSVFDPKFPAANFEPKVIYP